MNYNKLLQKVSRSDYTGGSFYYYNNHVNITMGSDSMNIHIEKDREIILEFDFTFEIPRDITFHVATKDVQKKILLILNQLYESIIPVFDETKD